MAVGMVPQNTEHKLQMYDLQVALSLERRHRLAQALAQALIAVMLCSAQHLSQALLWQKKLACAGKHHSHALLVGA